MLGMQYRNGYIDPSVIQSGLSFIPYLIHIPILIFLAFRFIKKADDRSIRPVLAIGLSVKVISGLFLGYLYFNFYQVGDTVYYYQDSLVIRDAMIHHPSEYFSFLTGEELQSYDRLIYRGGPRALFFLKLISPLFFITAGSYWLTSMYLSLLSFCTAWKLFKSIDRYFPSVGMVSLVGLLFLPSVVFWGAGFLKESLAVSCLYYLISVTLDISWTKKVPLVQIIFVLPTLAILFYLKYYLFGICVPLLISYISVCRFLPQHNMYIRLFIGWGIFVGLIFAASFLHPNLHPQNILKALLVNHDATIAISDPGTYYETGLSQQSSLGEVVSAVPKTFFAGLYRPFVWEVSNLPSLVASIENLLILLLTVVSFVLVFKFRIRFTVETWYLLMFVLLLAVLLTIASPNYGSLSRYKIYYLPFWFMLVAYPFQVFLEQNFVRKKSQVDEK